MKIVQNFKKLPNTSECVLCGFKNDPKITNPYQSMEHHYIRNHFKAVNIITGEVCREHINLFPQNHNKAMKDYITSD